MKKGKKREILLFSPATTKVAIHWKHKITPF